MKNARHEQILLLVEKYEIETQEELAERLNEAGFTVTQATVSRDIRQLQLRKIPSASGGFHYAVGAPGTEGLSLMYNRVLEDAFVAADCAGNLVVVHTVSGMAMAAAAAIDSLDWREVLGCIAGDDTIMIAVRSEEDGPEVVSRIRSVSRPAKS